MTIRVLVAKPGLDGHDKGAKIVAQALRDAGMEVIYSGLHRSVEEIVKTAIEEDVDVIGLSILSGAHNAICDKLFRQLKKSGGADKFVILGGVIPKTDWEKLHTMGVRAIFPMSTPFDEIASTIRKVVETPCPTTKKSRS